MFISDADGKTTKPEPILEGQVLDIVLDPPLDSRSSNLLSVLFRQEWNEYPIYTNWNVQTEYLKKWKQNISRSIRICHSQNSWLKIA